MNAISILTEIIASMTEDASTQLHLRTRVVAAIDSERGKLREKENLSATSSKKGKIKAAKPTRDGNQKVSVRDGFGHTFALKNVTPALLLDSACNAIAEQHVLRHVDATSVTIDWLPEVTASWLREKLLSVEEAQSEAAKVIAGPAIPA